MQLLLAAIKKIIKASINKPQADRNELTDELILAISTDSKINPSLEILCHFTIPEKIVIILSLIPNYSPSFFDNIIKELLPNAGDFPEFGGVRGANHRGFLPTGETAQFILAGSDFEKRLEIQYLLTEGKLVKENILWLEPVRDGEPLMSGKIVLSQDWTDKILLGKIRPPKFSPDFPAKLVTTKMDWEDLVLNPKTAQPINDIKIWLHHNATFLQDWGMDKKIKPGFRALFYGPPGTGKTLTATLLGKQFQKDVYRIDLSQVVSKYIGETEKNLEKIFAKAENKNWILFFDEADALFGKRSSVQNAHDKYANQEVSYLLQRVEDFPGLIILASNFKSNLDSAFIRRFNSIIYFPMPDQEERYKIWRNSIPAKAGLGEDVDLLAIARRYELSGSAIVSVIHYASLQTIYKGGAIISKADIIEGIKREYEKEERVFSNL
jgi:ATPase family associated with various cellular activities (AAA)